MEIGLPGKLGLPVAKRVAMGQGHVYDCATILLRIMMEWIVKEKEIKQKFVWSAIVQVNLIFLCWDISWTIKDASLSFSISLDLSTEISLISFSCFASLSMYV